MANFCGNCGSPLNPGSRFCRSCGTATEAAMAVTPNAEPVQEPASVPTPAPAVKSVDKAPAAAAPAPTPAPVEESIPKPETKPDPAPKRETIHEKPAEPAKSKVTAKPERPEKSGKKGIRKALALIVAAALALGFLPGLLDRSEIAPVTAIRNAEPLAAKTASEATAVALRQYIYARLATEAFASADLKSMSMNEIQEMLDDATQAWEAAGLAAYVADDISAQAIEVLEEYSITKTSSVMLPKEQGASPKASSLGIPLVAYAEGSPGNPDPKVWAENLTKQYDALRGAKRYQQLARQLGTDAKSAYKQIELAQAIIHGQAMEDAAFWDKLTKAAQATKTASKVGLLGISMVATGGGSVALLEGAGLLVGGVDCIVDVADTGSTIILGDGNQVSTVFGDIKEKMGPVSSVIGLVTLNPSGIGNTAKDTTEAMVYITDSLVDLFYEDKIVGIKVEGLSNNTIELSGQIFESGAKTALEAAGYVLPENDTVKALSDILNGWKPDQELMISRLDALASQMAAIYQNPELYRNTDENGLEAIPEEDLEEWENALKERENEGSAAQETPSGGSAVPPSGDSGAVSGWPGDFYGVALPAPETGGKITELKNEVNGFGDEVTTIRIEGMTHQEFEQYHKTLTALPGWALDGESNMPWSSYDSDRDYEFDGTYGGLPHISVFFFDEDTASDLNIPQFQMFVFKTY